MSGQKGKRNTLCSELGNQKRDTLHGKTRNNVVFMPEFFDGIAKIVEQAQVHIERSVNVAMCVTYYEVGRLIVEQEQSGASRATYGKKLLGELSAYLTTRCGKGWSVANLKNARQFYQVYSPSIRQSLISESGKGQTLSLDAVTAVIQEQHQVKHKDKHKVDQLDMQVAVLNVLENGTLSRKEIFAAIGMSGDHRAFKRTIEPLLIAGHVEMTIPDKPNSKLQKYRLTPKGKATIRRQGGCCDE